MMNAAAVARIAAWDVIAAEEIAAGTKVTVEDGWAVIHPRGGQPARVPYGPADTVGSLRNAFREALGATTQSAH